MMNIKKYVHGPEHLKDVYIQWWNKRRAFTLKTGNALYSNDAELTLDQKDDLIQEAYLLIGEGYMIARAARQRWNDYNDIEDKIPEEYSFMSYDQIMNDLNLIDYDLYEILDLDPVTKEYKDACKRLLEKIFGEKTEAEKMKDQLCGKVNYKP